MPRTSPTGSIELSSSPAGAKSGFPEKAAAVLHFVDEFQRRAPGAVQTNGITVTPEIRAKLDQHVNRLGVEFWIFLHSADNGLPPLPD